MPKMVIEVPEELIEVGKAMAEQLAELQRTIERQGNGNAVDHAKSGAAVFGKLPFEKVAHLVGALAVADHQDIEDALIDAYEVPT